MPTDVWVAILGLIGVIFSATATCISAKIATKVAKSQKETDDRAKRRAHESLLAMELMYAACDLSLVCAKKLTGQHTNGDVEEAMNTAKVAQDKYKEFCREQAAREFAEI